MIHFSIYLKSFKFLYMRCISDVFCQYTKGSTDHDIKCTLPNNAFYRAVYPTLWYIFVIMWIVFGISLVYQVFCFITRKDYIKKRVSILHFVLGICYCNFSIIKANYIYLRIHIPIKMLKNKIRSTITTIHYE